MKGNVTLSLEDYHKLKDAADSYSSKEKAIESERGKMSEQLKFTRTMFTVWTRYILDTLDGDSSPDRMRKLTEEFNKKGLNATMEMRMEGELPYIIPRQKTDDYL